MSNPQKPTATLEQLKRYSEAFNQSATLKNFGVMVHFPDLQTVEAVIDPVRDNHRGGLGTDAVNGGVLAAIFDLVIGCTPALLDPTRRSATVQLSMNFMRALRGNKLVAQGKIERAGELLVFASAQIADEQGVVCATCSGMSRRSELPWAAGDSPAIN